MMSQALRDARRYEEAMERAITPEERPAFHLSSRVGWMNDPNGFCWHNGQYHMFYQYHPYDSQWGPMHWGHAVSKDLLRWEFLPAALAPDMPYDRDGCFSGSALTLPDGRHLLMYTSVERTMTRDGLVKGVQTQSLAFGDGVDYEKYDKNPILTAKDLPAGGSAFDFRDPKIWQEPDGTYRALCVNDNTDGGGQMLLYKTSDLEHWALDTVLAANNGRIGRMWECPDFFQLDGYWVLLSSAQDMLPKGFEYHNGDGTFYMLGQVNPETKQFESQCDYAVDYGIDFYAPQTVLTPDGRRVMIGWMQNWDTCSPRNPTYKWFGQMSLPRELFIKDGKMYQRPIRELESLRGAHVAYQNITVENGEITLDGIKGRCGDLEIEILPNDTLYNRFAVRFAKDAEHHTGVSFRPLESVLKVDRKFSGSRRAIIHQRRAKVDHTGGAIKLRLILDRFSVEVFVNDGEKVMTSTLHTDLSADAISFYADGKATFNVSFYPLDRV